MTADPAPPNAALTTLKQAIAELYHCVEVGPEWFTHGRSAQIEHARQWYRRAETAIAEIAASCATREASDDR